MSKFNTVLFFQIAITVLLCTFHGAVGDRRVTPQNIDSIWMNFQLRLWLQNDLYGVSLSGRPPKAQGARYLTGRLELFKERRSQGEFKIAGTWDGDSVTFYFTIHKSLAKESIFKLGDGGWPFIIVALGEFCRADSLVKNELEIFNSVVRQGEKLRIRVSAHGKGQLGVMFTSGCQFGYSIQSNNGAHLSPELRPCPLSISSIEFDAQSSYSKDFEVPTYATQGDYWPFTDGYLPPGEYVLLAGLLDGSGEIPWARSHFRVVAR